VTWFRVDDGFSDHAKVHALQESKHWKGALALWTLAGAWCAKHEKDGFVPSSTVKRLGFVPAEADALVECGLWDAAEGGYHFHQWAERNPLRSELDAKREQTRNRVSGWRELKRNAVTPGYGNASVTPPPSRPVPDPSRPVPESERARPRPEPVDRLPEPEPDTGQEFTDRRMQTAFWAEYEAVQKVPPNMAGKNLAGFHAVVCRTASLQGQDPHTFFVDKVRAWLGNPLGEIERQAPYACFRQAWGDLAAVGEAKGGTGEPETVESLRKVGSAAAIRGDQAEVARIAKRIDALEKRADRQVSRAR
jgi:hypothetical protein